MLPVSHALRAGLAPPLPATRRARVLLAGAGGPLGSAVLERLLSHGGFEAVVALVTQPIDVALAGLVAWQVDGIFAGDAPTARALKDGRPAEAVGPVDGPAQHGAGTAVVVFDREGSRHGREAAFLRPLPAQLTALATALRRSGVVRLVLVLPHAPGLLPQALRAGLANLDEQAVAALGFDQLVLVRPARQAGSQPAAGPGTRSLGARVARLVLSQLHWLVPQREQPLRAAKVAEFVAALSSRLEQGVPGVRVVAPEALWDWAQPGGGEAWLQAWLAGQTQPAIIPG